MSVREEEVLDQYSKNPRYLSKSFIDSIPWNEIGKHSIHERFFPIILYMRDIEAFTDIYYQQLRRTPTGQDPIIRKFMDRWLMEEATHAELLDRFLNEAGFPTEKKWLDIARSKIPQKYTASSQMTTKLTNLFGKRFSSVHMTWGAINELSTLQGYKRLWELAGHPVLQQILQGIAREEASHIFFYYTVAKIKLEESTWNQQLTRFVIKHFWRPVGSGIKPDEDSQYVIRELFNGVDAMDVVRNNINGSIEKLPGFQGTQIITERIGKIATSG